MGNSTRGRALDVAVRVEDAVGDLDLALVVLEDALLPLRLPLAPTRAEVAAALREVSSAAGSSRVVRWRLNDIRADSGSGEMMRQVPGGPGEHLRACSIHYRRVVDATRSWKRTPDRDRAPQGERRSERNAADLRLGGTLAGFVCLVMAELNPDVHGFRVRPSCCGLGVAALGAYLLARQHLPVERAAECLADCFGAPVSTGYPASLLPTAASRLEGFKALLQKELTQA
jgi:hypothetical protein